MQLFDKPLFALGYFLDVVALRRPNAAPFGLAL
jgi:hypothetical protein